MPFVPAPATSRYSPQSAAPSSQQRRNPSLTVLVKHPDAKASAWGNDGGQYETPCSRISRFGAFSGGRIGPGAGRPGVPCLRLRTLSLRLRSRLRLLRLPSSLLPSSLLRLLSSLPPPSPLVSLLKEVVALPDDG